MGKALSISGPYVDDSHLAKIVADGKAKHGERFDESELRAAKHFAPYLRGHRLKVRTNYPGGEVFERTGTVGMTSGWRPAFLLMHRSNSMGSWDVLSGKDEIIAGWNGRKYEPVTPCTWQRHRSGAIEVLDTDAYLAERRYYDECDGKWKNSADIVTCLTCNRSWDDAVVTGVTPAPSARCPFEYDHEEVDA